MSYAATTSDVAILRHKTLNSLRLHPGKEIPILKAVDGGAGGDGGARIHALNQNNYRFVFNEHKA